MRKRGIKRDMEREKDKGRNDKQREIQRNKEKEREMTFRERDTKKERERGGKLKSPTHPKNS